MHVLHFICCYNLPIDKRWRMTTKEKRKNCSSTCALTHCSNIHGTCCNPHTNMTKNGENRNDFFFRLLLLLLLLLPVLMPISVVCCVRWVIYSFAIASISTLPCQPVLLIRFNRMVRCTKCRIVFTLSNPQFPILQCAVRTTLRAAPDDGNKVWKTSFLFPFTTAAIAATFH